MMHEASWKKDLACGKRLDVWGEGIDCVGGGVRKGERMAAEDREGKRPGAAIKWRAT